MQKHVVISLIIFIIASVSLAAPRVCYGLHCLKTTPASALIDPDKEYTYQDPSQFPKKELQGQYRKPSRFIDLESLDMNQSLTRNFLLGDFMDVSRGRYAVFSPAVAAIMQAIRNTLSTPIYINSGYRSPGHNGQTDGSALWSRHMYGDAVDFTDDDGDYARLQSLCEKNKASFTLIYKAHIHCDWRLLPLDPHFYPPTLAPEREHLILQMADAVELEPVSVSATSFTLIAHLDELEGENDDLIYGWSVTLPSGVVLNSSAEKIELPRQRGRYNIRVTIGKTITVERTIETE